MSRPYIIGIWLTVAVILAAWVVNTAAHSQQPVKEPKWEYKIISDNDLARHDNPGIDDDRNRDWAVSTEKGLNKFAHQGWELVAVTGTANNFKAFLRRSK